MAGSDYQYLLEVFDTDGKNRLHQSLVKPDWLPAIEAARFQALRDGGSASTVDQKVIPTFQEGHDQPYLSGVRAVVRDENGRETAVDIPLRFFLPYAQDAAKPLLDTGVLKAGDQFLYMVKSYQVSSEHELAMEAPVVQRRSASPINGRRALEDFTNRVEGSAGGGLEPFPVFVPGHVLAEAEELKQQAGAMETGGIIIGFIWQDPASGMIFTEVTAFVPARHTIPGSTKLTFTADTWADLRAAIKLRGLGESFVGWVHTHPARFWCTCCDDPAKMENCPLAGQFFSKDDILLHRTVFHSAQHVAIVLGDQYMPETGWETIYSAFGWANGLIASRAFHILGDDSQAPASKKEAEIANSRQA